MSNEYDKEGQNWRREDYGSSEVDQMSHEFDNQNFYESEAGTVEGAAEVVEYSEPVAPMFRKAIRWLIYAAAFLAPLWFLPLTLNVLELNKQVLVVIIAGAGLVLYLLDIIKTGIWRYRPSHLVWPILGLVGASAVSVIFSVSRYASVFGSVNGRGASLLTLAAMAALFVLAINTIEDRGKTLRKFISISLALAFIFAFLQLFGVYIFKAAGLASRSFNSIGSFNTVGILAAVALGFLSIGAGAGKEEDGGGLPGWFNVVSRFANYAGFLLALFFVILINWWPVWTVAFVAILASVAFQAAGQASSFRRMKMRLLAPPLAVIVLGIFLMLVNFNWASIKSRLPLEVAPSQGVSWGIALDALKSRPLGFGGENFAIAYDKFKPASIANTIFYQVRFTDATSEAANLATEGGALMLLALVGLLWFYGKELVKSVRDGNFDESVGVIWAPTAALFAALFLYPFNMTLLTLLVLMLAMVAIQRSGEERVINLESDAKYSFLGSLAFIAGLVLVLVAGYFTFNNYRSNVLLAKAASESDRNKAIELYVESSNGNPRDARVLRLLSQTVLAQLADELQTGPKKDETREGYNARVQNLIASAVNISVRATDTDPADSQNWANRGLVYQNLLTLVGGADQAAVNMYNESLKRNPSDPQTYLRLGNLYLTIAENIQRVIANPRGQSLDFAALRRQADENLDKAEESFKQAIGLYNNFGQALYNLAVVYDRKGELGQAIAQFERLQAGNPRDPSLVFQLGLLYYRNNQKDNALRAWERAVFLFPNYSNARWYLSLILEERGNLDGALAQVREIERLNPDNDLVKQRLTQLEAGKRNIPPEKVLDQQPLNQ